MYLNKIRFDWISCFQFVREIYVFFTVRKSNPVYYHIIDNEGWKRMISVKTNSNKLKISNKAWLDVMPSTFELRKVAFFKSTMQKLQVINWYLSTQPRHYSNCVTWPLDLFLPFPDKYKWLFFGKMWYGHLFEKKLHRVFFNYARKWGIAFLDSNFWASCNAISQIPFAF